MSSLPPDRSNVPTEIAHPSGRDLGSASIRESIEWIAEDHRQVVDALRAAGAPLESLIEAVVDALEAGGRLVYVGAGTSGRLGVLDASECPLGFLNETYPACNSTGLVLGERCWAIVPDDPDQPPTCGDEPPTDCAYTGPPFDDTQRRRLSISSGPGGFKAVGNNPTTAKPESYSYTYKEAPTAAPTTETGSPTSL